MFFKILIVTVLLVAIVVLALGVKLFFNEDAEFEMHACEFDERQRKNGDLDYSSCQLKEISDCSET